MKMSFSHVICNGRTRDNKVTRKLTFKTANGVLPEIKIALNIRNLQFTINIAMYLVDSCFQPSLSAIQLEIYFFN